VNSPLHKFQSFSTRYISPVRKKIYVTILLYGNKLLGIVSPIFTAVFQYVENKVALLN
jgi:hypothetical protein